MGSPNYEKLLRAVGNAVAGEKGWPKPGSRVEYCEEFECQPGESGCSVHLGSAYLEASDECEKLRLAAEESDIKIDFNLGHGAGLLVKTDWKVLGWKKSFGYASKVISRTHYFAVDGYRCKNAGALLDNADSLNDISVVEESFGPAERAELAFCLLDEICERYEAGLPGKNSARLLG